jgi:hypothetical protein
MHTSVSDAIVILPQQIEKREATWLWLYIMVPESGGDKSGGA